MNLFQHFADMATNQLSAATGVKVKVNWYQDQFTVFADSAEDMKAAHDFIIAGGEYKLDNAKTQDEHGEPWFVNQYKPVSR